MLSDLLLHVCALQMSLNAPSYRQTQPPRINSGATTSRLPLQGATPAYQPYDPSQPFVSQPGSSSAYPSAAASCGVKRPRADAANAPRAGASLPSTSSGWEEGGAAKRQPGVVAAGGQKARRKRHGGRGGRGGSSSDEDWQQEEEEEDDEMDVEDDDWFEEQSGGGGGPLARASAAWRERTSGASRKKGSGRPGHGHGQHHHHRHHHHHHHHHHHSAGAASAPQDLVRYGSTAVQPSGTGAAAPPYEGPEVFEYAGPLPPALSDAIAVDAAAEAAARQALQQPQARLSTGSQANGTLALPAVPAATPGTPLPALPEQAWVVGASGKSPRPCPTDVPVVRGSSASMLSAADQILLEIKVDSDEDEVTLVRGFSGNAAGQAGSKHGGSGNTGSASVGRGRPLVLPLDLPMLGGGAGKAADAGGASALGPYEGCTTLLRAQLWEAHAQGQGVAALPPGRLHSYASNNGPCSPPKRTSGSGLPAVPAKQYSHQGQLGSTERLQAPWSCEDVTPVAAGSAGAVLVGGWEVPAGSYRDQVSCGNVAMGSWHWWKEGQSVQRTK